jgi:hypothetical protein
MPSDRLTEEKRRELVEFALGYGKILAREAYGPQGPGLDVDLAGLEAIAVQMQQALLKGFCEATTTGQAGRLPQAQPCPDCGRECPVESPEENDTSRPMQLRGGSFELAEPRCYCRSCRRSFFPSAGGFAD